VIEGTRTQLIDADLDHCFWAEVATAHCYVRGFILSNRHPDVVPWVAWFRQKDAQGNLVKLNVSHLRVWGSRCWVKDLDNIEGKLGKQGWEGRMVGYLGRRGYRVYDPKRYCVFPVRNIIFEEGEPHRTRPDADEDAQLPQDLRIFEDDIPSDDEALPEPDERVDAPVPTLPAPAPIIQLIPDPPRRSNRVPKPTRAILEMELFHRGEEQARLAGEDWAHDDRRPMQLMLTG
jgi:hypothetical protein